MARRAGQVWRSSDQQNRKRTSDLADWLETLNIAGATKLALNIRTQVFKSKNASVNGHVWHAKVVKAIHYRSKHLKVREIEQQYDGYDVDLRLGDMHGDDINIQAWSTTTRRNKPRMNAKLRKKIKQLPPTGRNFVLWKSNLCKMTMRMPVSRGKVIIRVLDNMITIHADINTARNHIETGIRIAKSLGLNYEIMYYKQTRLWNNPVAV